MIANLAASLQVDELLAGFLADHPALDRDRLAPRFERALWLWRQGCVRPEGDGYRVRAAHPEQKWPGEATAYSVTLRANLRRCDCTDYGVRGREAGYWCKHLLATWLLQRHGDIARPLPLAPISTPAPHDAPVRCALKRGCPESALPASPYCARHKYLALDIL